MDLAGSYNKLLFTICAAALFSCNSADKPTPENNPPGSFTTGKDTAVNSIVTTPENIMFVRHKVADYRNWLAGFESADSMKSAHGLHNDLIGRSLEDSNLIVVATTADNLSTAKTFGNSRELKQAMQKLHVTTKPAMNYVMTVYRDTAPPNSDLRALELLTVKDWNTWKAQFDSSRRDRIKAGLMDRVYGYDPDDRHKVIIVTAIADTARANSFWHSPGMKQAMSERGVIGNPERVLFRVSKKY